MSASALRLAFARVVLELCAIEWELLASRGQLRVTIPMLTTRHARA